MDLPTVSTRPQPFLRNHLIRDASWKAVYDLMREDSSVHVFGEGAVVKAHYDAPAIERDFPDRVHTMPISEDGNTNFAVGAALLGIKPIVDMIGADFLYRAMDSICNTAAKLALVRSEPPTIVIRAEFMTGGPTTGQRPEALFAHIPGLRVVVPSTPRDAYGLMRTALTTPGVTLYFEDREIADAIPFEEEEMVLGERIPFGHLHCRMGQRGVCTVVTYGVMHQRIHAMLRGIPRNGFDPEGGMRADLIDLRSLYPIDWKALKFFLGRTGRMLIVEPDVAYGGIGAEIAARIAEEMPHVRIRRIGAPRASIPAAQSLHGRMLPSEKEVADAIRSDW